MGLTITVDVGGLKNWQRYANEATLRAARMAGRDAIKAMRAEGSRRIRERKAMKVASIGKALSIVYPSSKQSLLWRVKASGAIMPVAAFPYRQTKKGVSVVINKGQRKLIAHAFEAKMKSGHVGIFTRQGKTRLPIREAFTTRVSEAFTDAIPAIADRGEAVFRRTFARVLPLGASRLNLTRAA